MPAINRLTAASSTACRQRPSAESDCAGHTASVSVRWTQPLAMRGQQRLDLIEQRRAGEEVEEADGIGVIAACLHATALQDGGAAATRHGRSAPGSVRWLSHLHSTPLRRPTSPRISSACA
jgi:hypothetical protein